MARREEVLEKWKNCLAKIKELKQRVNPEVLNLEKQILTKYKELKTKQERIKQLKENLPERAPVLGGSVPPPTPQEKELDNLGHQEWEISQQLSAWQARLVEIYPLVYDSLKGEIANLQRKNEQLNYLKSLHNSLISREHENQQYEERVKVAETKWSNAEKKLEKVRDLVAEGKIENLKGLLKKGLI